MGRRRCCCNGCEIGRDTFDRADNEILGPKWPDEINGHTAQTGDWDIHDNTAEIQHSSGGIAIFGTREPTPDEAMVAWVNCPDIQVGDIYELILNWKDMSTYFFAQIEATLESPPGVVWITARLGACSGGVRSTLVEVEVGRSFSDPITGLHHILMNALIGEEGLCLLMTGTGPDIPKVWEEASPVGEGYWAGIGASGRDNMQLDDFVFWKHFENDPDCPHCICKCGSVTVPKKLTATFVDCTGRMIGADGCEIEIEWQQETVAGLPNPPYSGWYGTAVCCGGELMVNFQCVEGDDPSEMTCYTTNCNSFDLLLQANKESRCAPLYFRFGPYFVGQSDLVCMCGAPLIDPAGEFYIEITE